MIVYLDTSAALKLVVDESESDGLAEWLNDSGDQLVSSMLLMTELHCAAVRRSELPVATVAAVLDAVTLVDVSRVDLERAATSRWGLRSADAIHLATALRVGASAVVAYDREMQDVCSSLGLEVIAPS